MDETAADHRLHHNHTVLESVVQGGRHPKIGKKKGGIKVHTVIHANEGVPSDIKFTSAATNDSFMLKPSTLSKGDIIAMDRAYIDYEKFEQLTERGGHLRYQNEKSLKYNIQKDNMRQNADGLNGSEDATCDVYQRQKRWRDNHPSRTYHNIC